MGRTNKENSSKKNTIPTTSRKDTVLHAASASIPKTSVRYTISNTIDKLLDKAEGETKTGRIDICKRCLSDTEMLETKHLFKDEGQKDLCKGDESVSSKQEEEKDSSKGEERVSSKEEKDSSKREESVLSKQEEEKDSSKGEERVSSMEEEKEPPKEEQELSTDDEKVLLSTEPEELE